MALHRKFDALLRLQPDIAVICECAEAQRLGALTSALTSSPVWIGRNRNKGLAVLSFNGYAARLANPFYPTLRHVAPVHIAGPIECNLLAVWAQNASDGVNRKHQLGPLRRALSKYRAFLAERPSIVAGDFNNNDFWHRPGWRINHVNAVADLERAGLVSAYHEVRGERQGNETEPTLYWRDRKKDGPTYHIDYIFLPRQWLPRVQRLTVGSFEEWCGSGLSDHVPIVVDLEVESGTSDVGQMTRVREDGYPKAELDQITTDPLLACAPALAAAPQSVDDHGQDVAAPTKLPRSLRRT